MLKDVVIYLTGMAEDDLRIAAGGGLARLLDASITGLYINTLPELVMPVEPADAGAAYALDLQERARERGDRTETVLAAKLETLGRPVFLRRYDLFADQISHSATIVVRSADCFVALRPGTAPEEDQPSDLVDQVLLECGRHVFLVPGPAPEGFGRALVAWNESREAARAVHEALPYLIKAEAVDVLVIDEDGAPDLGSARGADLVKHLIHCGVRATLDVVPKGEDGVSATLMSEAARRRADLIVMGGYSRSRLREKLLGGPTYDLLHASPVPLIVAH
jgi:nucleotide-binding universal stress UspA family protein